MAKKKGAQTRKKKEQSSDSWPLVLGLALLIIIITILVTLLSQEQTYPVETSLTSALNAFRQQNVSEIILNDLAVDFSSGNYSIEELGRMYPGFETDIRTVNKKLSTDQDETVATVNGEIITRTELERQASLLPQDLRAMMTDEQILGQMIDEELLMQDAEAKGIEPTQEMIDGAYMQLLQGGDITEEQLIQNVQSYGLDLQDIRTMLIQQLTITMVLNESVESMVEVTEADKQAFYENYKESFTAEEEVTVRHILLSTIERTPEEALTEAETIVARYEAGEDFCDLVIEATDDAGSKGTCGEYTFGAGYMVPPFEEASFDMDIDEIRIVETSFGQHIIEKLDEVTAAVPSYEEVEAQIEEQVSSGQRTVAYQDYIEQLRADAAIVNYLTGDGTDQLTGNTVLEVEDGEVIVELNPETESNTQVTIVAPEQPEPIETEPVESVEPIEVVEPVEPIETVEPEPVETVEPEPVEPEGPLTTEELAACLGENAILYTSSWATSSMKEAEKFGDAASLLYVVDCAAESCPVSAYPAWEIGGATHLGSKSFEELEALAGC